MLGTRPRMRDTAISRSAGYRAADGVAIVECQQYGLKPVRNGSPGRHERLEQIRTVRTGADPGQRRPHVRRRVVHVVATGALRRRMLQKEHTSAFHVATVQAEAIRSRRPGALHGDAGQDGIERGAAGSPCSEVDVQLFFL